MAALTFLSRFQVKAGREDEFLALVDKLTAAVHADEPECTHYQFFKLREPERGYAVFESFTSEAAEQAHLNTPHFAELGPPMVECLDGEYVREYLDPVRSD
ncbi:MAG: antibiotic biosynthesis monooxygenase [Pseudomonadota bacterium]